MKRKQPSLTSFFKKKTALSSAEENIEQQENIEPEPQPEENIEQQENIQEVELPVQVEEEEEPSHSRSDALDLFERG